MSSLDGSVSRATMSMPAADTATAQQTLRARLGERLRSSGLRRRIKSSRSYWRVKLFLKRIAGRELWQRRGLRTPTLSCEDWLYAPAALPAGAIVYCFGIGESIDFERALIERHAAAVHGFDPTPASMRWIETQPLPPGFAFHPWAVAGQDGELTLYPRISRHGQKSKTMWTADPAQADVERAITVPALTVASIMRKLGHTRVDLLKLDVEGAEYAVIDGLLSSPAAPAQLLIEFHHRFPGIGKQKTRDYIGKLEAAGYEIFGISRTGRELSFMGPAGKRAAGLDRAT